MRNMIFIMLLCSMTLVFANGENWNRVSSNMNYTIYYPSQGWHVGQVYAKEKTTDKVVQEQVLVWSDGGSYITIDVWKSNMRLKLKHWLMAMEGKLGINPALLQKTQATANNLPAYYYEFQAEGKQAFNSQMTFFRHQKKVFRVTYLEREGGHSGVVYQQLIYKLEFKTYAEKIPALPEEKPQSGGVSTMVYSCGGQADTCYCGFDNPYPCCDNGGNCTWYAWHQACCVWGIALPSPWRHAKYWAGDLASHGYNVSGTPAVNTIACNTQGTYGHVAWVVQVSGSQVKVLEMNCCSGCNYGVREYWYSASYFNGGYISP